MTHRQCFECGKHAHHNHHVVPQELGGTKTVPLCVPCHGKAHGVAIGISGDEYIRRVSRGTRRALDQKSRRGERVGSVPYGFRVGPDGKALEPHPVEAEVIRIARGLRSQGGSLRGIAKALEGQGYVSRAGHRFSPTQINRLLEVTDAEVLTVGEF